MYKNNYKPLNKETEEDYKSLKSLPYLGFGRINRVKMATLPKIIYMFNAIPMKILMTSSQRLKNPS
jgi:hypothetical protein